MVTKTAIGEHDTHKVEYNTNGKWKLEMCDNEKFWKLVNILIKLWNMELTFYQGRSDGGGVYRYIYPPQNQAK